MNHHNGSVRTRRGIAASFAAAALAAAPAHATWSILIADTRTGEIVLGSATCLTGLDLAVSTPVVIAGRGAITAQSAVDSTGRNRMFARDAILRGDDPATILEDLSTLDPGHDNRQYGMINALGQALTFSGALNADWAGGVTGRLERGAPGPRDDIVYAVQGNILIGPEVVADTVASIEGAKGSDLPKMLMDAMVAARLAGGDGRCSCSSAAPTSCAGEITPPFKSAHIGYMIGSRLGDTNLIQAFYDLEGTSSGHASIDLNNDSVPDSAVTLGSTGLVSLHLNPTGVNDAVSRLEFLATVDTGLGTISDPVALDLNADSLDDLVMIANGSTIAAMIQTSPGVFGAPITLDLGEDASSVEPGNADADAADEAIVAIRSTGEVIAVGLESGSLAAGVLADTGALSVRARLGDADGDGADDLLVALRNTDELWIGRGEGDGAFTEWVRLASADQPEDMGIADVNADTVPDVVVLSDRGARIETFMGTGAGFDPPVATAIGEDGVAMRLGTLATNTPGDPVDLVAITEDDLFSGTVRRLRTYDGDGSGAFTPRTSFRVNPASESISLRNQNPGCDDDTDIVTLSGSRLIVLDNDGDGNTPLSAGFAGGDHYMFINIANQSATDEDPVDQMEPLFDAFRASLDGEVDAVRSATTPPARILTGREAKARVELRDLEGDPIGSDASFSFKALGAPIAIGSPVGLGAGVYDIPLSDLDGATGGAVVEVRVRVEGREVVLMPRLRVGITDIAADMNGDGVAGFDDVSRFVRALAQGDPIADLDADGVVEPDEDTNAFLASFNAP